MMPEKWTKRSRPPSSGVMKPKPLSSENHLTVPDAMPALPHSDGAPGAPSDDRPLSTGPDADKPIPNEFARASAVRIGLARASGPCQLGGGGGDLVAVAGLGRPRQAQRVRGVARDHV